MRTLKKALCLVLVLSMVMGIGVLGASAAYNDADQIKYKEAVDVMSAIGVMQGIGDGKFDPNGTFTRAQAAKMLSYMILGETAAEALPASSGDFSDVSADQWFSKYISFGVSEGYLAGMGDGSFKPDDPVTGYQWAKMLLCALGYDPKTEGFEGVGYEINVAKYAITKLKLFDGNMGADYNVAATREEAALYAFNMIQKNTVKYEGTTTVVINGVEVTMGNGTAVVEIAGETGTFMYQHFNGLKKVTTATADAYGRPTAEWQWKVKNVYKTIAETAATPVAVYTNAISSNELYSKLGAKAVIDASESSLVGLTKNAGSIWYDGKSDTNDVNVGTNSKVLGGNGIITEIYETATDNTYIVVQIRPRLAKVTSVTNTAATKTKGAYTTYTIGGKDYNVFTSVVNDDNDKSTVTINGTIAKDSYVMIYGLGTADSPAVVNTVTLVEGKLTGYNSSDKTYTIGGNAYAKSDANANSIADTGFNAYNTDATYAVDAYGYVIGTVDVTVPSNYIYVLNVGSFADYLNTTTNKIEKVYEVAAITTTGEVKTIQVSKIGNNAPDETSNNTKNGLYTYTLDKDGKYELKTTPAPVEDNVDTINKTPVLKDNTMYADTATKYFVAKYDSETKAWSVTAYTGYANINLTGDPTATALDTNSDKVAEIVFVNGGTVAGATADYVYVTGSFTTDGTKYTYNVIVNGEATTMELQSGLTAGLYSVDDGKATQVTGTAALDIAAGTDGKYDKNTYFTYSNGLLTTSATAGGEYSYLAAVGADVPVYTIQNGACTSSTAADLSAANGELVVIAVNSARDAISAIYIVK